MRLYFPSRFISALLCTKIVCHNQAAPSPSLQLRPILDADRQTPANAGVCSSLDVSNRVESALYAVARLHVDDDVAA